MTYLMRVIVLIWLVFLMTACKVEEFTGFKIETISQNESLRLSGHVISYYTSDSVMAAFVTIGSRQAITDDQGEFSIFYVLSESEKRNKPTPVDIFAENYYPYHSLLYLSQQNTHFVFYLKYAAPIILDATAVFQRTYEYDYICQAIVKDFQGVSTIQYVKAVFFNKDAVGDSVISFLQLKEYVDSQTGRFQSTVKFPDWYPDRFYLQVSDKEGYQDWLAKSLTGIEKLIFNP